MRRTLTTLMAIAMLAAPSLAQAPDVTPAPSPALSTPATPASNGPLDLTARVDHSSIGLGETLTLTVDVAWPADVEVMLPAAESLDFAPFEVRDAVTTPQPNASGRKVVRYTVRLAAYEPGRQTVPSLKVEYKTADNTTKTAASAPIPVDVQRAASVQAPAASGAPADIRDLKPMDEIPTPAWMIAAVAGGGVLGLVLMGLGGRALWKRMRRPKVVPTTPHGIALAALDALVAQNLPAQGHLKTHYDRLAEILRAYLAQRFDLPVLEHTTAEVVAMMRERSFEETLRNDVRLVLDEADLVKFARLQVPLEKAFAQAHAVRTIVERTIPAPLQAGDDKPAADQAMQPPAGAPVAAGRKGGER